MRLLCRFETGLSRCQVAAAPQQSLGPADAACCWVGWGGGRQQQFAREGRVCALLSGAVRAGDLWACVQLDGSVAWALGCLAWQRAPGMGGGAAVVAVAGQGVGSVEGEQRAC